MQQQSHASALSKQEDESDDENLSGSSICGTFWFECVSQVYKKTSRDLSSSSKYEIQVYYYLLINVQQQHTTPFLRKLLANFGRHTRLRMKPEVVL